MIFFLILLLLFLPSGSWLSATRPPWLGLLWMEIFHRTSQTQEISSVCSLDATMVNRWLLIYEQFQVLHVFGASLSKNLPYFFWVLSHQGVLLLCLNCEWVI